MRILVIGGTGTVGSALVRELTGRGIDVRILSRTQGVTKAGVERIVGDLARPETLPPAFAGITRAYLLTPLARDEVSLGANAIAAAREAGIERLVFQSVLSAAEGEGVPHFESKVTLADRLRSSGVPWSIVAPSSFYQNDVRLRDLIVEGAVYPNPIGAVGVNRVDVIDIAAVAAAALLEPEYESREVAAVGPDEWTGAGIAEVYSDLLGREVRYPGDDLEAWAAAAGAHLAAWLVQDLARMFAHYHQRGMAATPDQLAETRVALGREPRPFAEFARELVAGA